MSIISAILANVFLVLSALGFGSLLRPLFAEKFSQFDNLALTLLGGLGILGTLLFCVGQVSFSRFTVILVFLVGIALFFKDGIPGCWRLQPCANRLAVPILPAALVFVALAVTAVGGLALITGDMNNDAIAYHYLGPKAWVREGIIRPVPDEILTYFPVVMETQYAALMSLGGQRAPGFFAVISLISALLISASLASRLGADESGTWWVAALVATMPAIYRGAYGGFLDVLFASVVLAAARIGFDADQPKHYALFGVFCGISMGTKYTGIIAWAILVLCVFVIAIWVRPSSHRKVTKLLAISCAVAVVMASPFYLRNWVVYGCPIYPPPAILLRFFAVKDMLPTVMQELTKNLLEQGQGMGGGLVNFLLLPFHLTYYTATFKGAGGIGLAPLALAPFGLIVARRNPFAVGLVLFSVLQTLAWFFTAQVSRYMIQVYVIAAIFAILGWQYSRQIKSQYLGIVSAAVIGISVLYGLSMIVPDRLEDVHATISASYEMNRRGREIPRVESFNFINNNPDVRKVLILNRGIAAYFVDKPYIKPFGRWGERTLPGATNIPSVMSQLSQLHVTHVLDVREDGGPFGLPDNPSGLSLVFEEPDQRIYRVNAENSSAPSP